MKNPAPDGWVSSVRVVGLVLLLAGCGPARQGDRAWEDGDFGAAAAAYGRAGSLDPLRQQRLARALAHEGDLAQAALLLSEFDDESLTPDGRMVRGYEALERGAPAEAAAHFTKGVALGGDAALRINACGALLTAGQADARVCSEALLAAPDDPAALLGLAAASIEEQNAEVARRCLARLLARPDLEPAIQAEVLRLLQLLGEWGAACKLASGPLADSALASSPASPSASSSASSSSPSLLSDIERISRLETGRICATAGDWDRAHDALEPLVDVEPSASFILGTMALERALATNTGAARERWVADARRRLARCEDAFAGTSAAWHNNMGRLEELDGELDAAEAAYRRAIALEPASDHARLNLAYLLHSRRRSAEGQVLMRALWQSSPQVGLTAGAELARWLMEDQDMASATEVAQQVFDHCQTAEIQPCIADMALFLAILAADEGDADAALERLGVAVGAGGADIREQARVEPAFKWLQEDIRFVAMLDDALVAP